MHVIISGLCKLSRVTMPPPGLIVYRGNGGMALPGDFLEPDEQGFAGGVEYALMSTTPDRSVALGYSGVETGKDLPTIFEIEIGKTSIGADISFLSHFEGEREYLYPPLTKPANGWYAAFGTLQWQEAVDRAHGAHGEPTVQDAGTGGEVAQGLARAACV